MKIPKSFKMISFDVLIFSNFFAKLLLEETITIILDKVYDEKKIETNTPRNIVQDPLYSCRKISLATTNVYSRRWSCHGITAGSTVDENFYDNIRRSCITNH